MKDMIERKYRGTNSMIQLWIIPEKEYNEILKASCDKTKEIIEMFFESDIDVIKTNLLMGVEVVIIEDYWIDDGPGNMDYIREYFPAYCGIPEDRDDPEYEDEGGLDGHLWTEFLERIEKHESAMKYELEC